MKKFFPYILMLIVLVGTFSPMMQVNAVDPPPAGDQTKYKLLAPLPGVGDSSDNVNTETGLGSYLNAMIKLFIGICAVLSVVMLVVGGLEYMTSELAHTKEAGKERMWQAVLGLLIALGAWALLNTINPNLLISDINIPKATVKIKSFAISGAQSIDGTAGGKVDFKGDACPAATAAQTATGVDRALILSIFAQESRGGADVGGCSSDGSPNSKGQTANMHPADVTNLQTILTGLGKNPPVNVSCASGGGHGGAMGGMQILPSTWISSGGAGKNPWNTGDAMMVAATYISDTKDPYLAACKYFGKCSFGGVDYAKNVVDRMDSIKQQIARDGC